MLSIDPNKAKFLNIESVRLIDLVEEVNPVRKSSPSSYKPQNSLDSRIEVSTTSLLTPVGPLMEYTEDTIIDKITSAYEVGGGRKYGLREEKMSGVYKLVEIILKENSFNKNVSKSFLIKKTLKWIFDAYRQKQIVENFSDYILAESTQAIKEHRFLFFVDKIEIAKTYLIGKCTLSFMSKSDIDKLEIQHNSDEGKSDESYFETIRKSYQGRVFISTIVRAEREKAAENALKECSLSVDVLKICSPTLNIPEYQIPFDIDKNAKRNYTHEFLIQSIEKPYNFEVNGQHDQAFYILNADTWQNSVLNKIDSFHNFLIQRGNSELCILVEISMTRFADALSKKNLHQRVVEIFTILESLLLKDEASSIIESVTKYCSKLVAKQKDERVEIIEVLKRMYKIRSSLIHHGLNKDFGIDDLEKLQVILTILLTVLIAKSANHSSKHSVLQEIDDAIMNAY